MERDLTMTGIYGPTVRMVSSDTAQSFSANVLANTDGEPSDSVIITCESNDIRIGWMTTPTQGASGVGHLLSSGDTFRIVGRDNILRFKFISAVNGIHGVLQITPEY